MTNYEKKKQQLIEKYTPQRTWRKSTNNYGFWVYPHNYYMELVDLVINKGKQ